MEVPLRFAWYTATFFCALFSSVAFGVQTVTKLRTDGVLLIVLVSINESGPYSFILDTGSNRTLVRNDLLEILGISSKKLVPVNMTNGVIHVRETIAKSIAVAGMSVNELEIEGIDTSQITRMGASIQGILGEDFLKHFDVLIDNRAHTLTLDNASDLADSLSGDHLPLSFSARHGNHPTVDRLVLDVSLSSIKSFRFQLDSGTNSATFFPSKGVEVCTRRRIPRNGQHSRHAAEATGRVRVGHAHSCVGLLRGIGAGDLDPYRRRRQQRPEGTDTGVIRHAAGPAVSQRQVQGPRRLHCLDPPARQGRLHSVLGCPPGKEAMSFARQGRILRR
jgi:hypothetical protein